MVRRRSCESKIEINLVINYPTRKDLFQRLFMVALAVGDAQRVIKSLPGVEVTNVTMKDETVDDKTVDDSGEEQSVENE